MNDFRQMFCALVCLEILGLMWVVWFSLLMETFLACALGERQFLCLFFVSTSLRHSLVCGA